MWCIIHPMQDYIALIYGFVKYNHKLMLYGILMHFYVSSIPMK